MSFGLRLTLVVLVAALSGCSDTSHSNTPPADTLSGKEPFTDTSARILVMPAPLQIPTLLIQYGSGQAVFEGTCISVARKKTFPSNYQRAVFIGMTSVDLGYFGLHNNRVHALEALTTAEKELKELNYQSGFPAAMRKLLENTNGNSIQDSLSKMLLTHFMQLQQQATQESTNKNGVFMMCGAYMEGLYILLREKSFYTHEMFPILLSQQKTWAGNLMEAVTYIPNDNDTQDLYNTLYTIEHYLNQSEEALTRDNVPVRKMAPENLDKLFGKVIQLRNSYIP
jgi:hypothetical protein